MDHTRVADALLMVTELSGLWKSLRIAEPAATDQMPLSPSAGVLADRLKTGLLQFV
jgi:hypothetical protein